MRYGETCVECWNGKVNHQAFSSSTTFILISLLLSLYLSVNNARKKNSFLPSFLQWCGFVIPPLALLFLFSVKKTINYRTYMNCFGWAAKFEGHFNVIFFLFRLNVTAFLFRSPPFLLNFLFFSTHRMMKKKVRRRTRPDPARQREGKRVSSTGDPSSNKPPSSLSPRRWL